MTRSIEHGRRRGPETIGGTHGLMGKGRLRLGVHLGRQPSLLGRWTIHRAQRADERHDERDGRGNWDWLQEIRDGSIESSSLEGLWRFRRREHASIRGLRATVTVVMAAVGG